jgi:ferredoxin-NADP reductase
LIWQVATVTTITEETPRVKSITFDISGWEGHRPGQHLDLRLSAEDGYQAQRSYSIASAPEDKGVTLTVERLEDGEVSPYLTDELVAGDQIEVRGPIGGFFVWDVGVGGPLFLVGGGSGIVPLMAMMRHSARAGNAAGIRLLFSTRSSEDVIYQEELRRFANPIEIFQTLTRSQPEGWPGYSRRVDREMLEEIAWPASQDPLTFICGPTSFVEGAAQHLVALGYDPQRVKTERFGPTGN